jgi:signal transduction histidine kinase
MNILNISISVSAITLCVLSILQVLAVGRLEPRHRHHFLLVYACLTLFAGCNLAGQLLAGRSGQNVHIALRFTNYGEFFFSAVLAYVGARYLLVLTDPDRRRELQIGFLALLAAHVILLTVSQFTDLLYVIDGANQYRRTSLFPLALAAPGATLLGCAALLLRSRSALPLRQRTAFWIYLMTPLAAMAVQAFFYGLNLIVLAMVIAAMTMYVFVLADQTSRYFRSVQETEKLKVNLMLNQIQPHFLYNSLGTIQALCRRDPEKAEQAVGDFAQFLRHNIRSIESDRPILFHQELIHTQNYLALQKLRFGDDLHIVYDLECETFSLPTLTLQPLVENAVTHGIRQTASGRGTVTIRTREMEDHYEVSVIDDGVGFDPTAPGTGSGAHIALNNIRARLARVSGGSLRVISAPGMGATVTILIPKAAVSDPQ